MTRSGAGGMKACGPVQKVITAELLRTVYHVEARVEACSKALPTVHVDGPVGRPAPP